MADRPIIFSGPMVRALREGRKTQTRRVLDLPLKEPPAIVREGMVISFDENGVPRQWPRTPAVSDRLWVRETGHTYHWDQPRAVYRADFDDGRKPCRVRTQIETYEVGRWTPAIHMPRWASRLTLLVTDVRVQRLHDIDETDAIAEGQPASSANSPRVWFSSLWNGLNAERGYGWDVNPWVVAVTFEVVKANIDTMTASPHSPLQDRDANHG